MGAPFVPFAHLKFKRIGTHFGRSKGSGGSLLHGRALSSGRAEGYLHGEGCSPRRAARPLHVCTSPGGQPLYINWYHGDTWGSLVSWGILRATWFKIKPWRPKWLKIKPLEAQLPSNSKAKEASEPNMYRGTFHDGQEVGPLDVNDKFVVYASILLNGSYEPYIYSIRNNFCCV